MNARYVPPKPFAIEFSRPIAAQELEPPPGFHFLHDEDGAFITDDDGALLVDET